MLLHCENVLLLDRILTNYVVLDVRQRHILIVIYSVIVIHFAGIALLKRS